MINMAPSMISYESALDMLQVLILAIILVRIIQVYYSKKESIRFKAVLYLSIAISFLLISTVIHTLDVSRYFFPEIIFLDHILRTLSFLILGAIILGPLTRRWKREMTTVFYFNIFLIVVFSIYVIYGHYPIQSPLEFNKNWTSRAYRIWDVLILIVIISIVYYYWDRFRSDKLLYIILAFAFLLIGTFDLIFIQPYFYLMDHLLFAFSYLILGYVAVTTLNFTEITADQVIFRVTPVIEDVDGEPEYRLVPGLSYLVKEEKPTKSLDIFVDQVTHGIPGLCITRINPLQLRNQYGLRKTPILWLTDITNMDIPHIYPKPEELFSIVSEFIDKTDNSVLLIDGIEYLISNNNFNITMHLIRRIRDTAAIGKCRVLISINPSVLEKIELSLLERETTPME